MPPYEHCATAIPLQCGDVLSDSPRRAAAARSSLAVTFEEVYTRFRRPVWALARRLTRSDDKALDACQEIFLRIWRDPEAPVGAVESLLAQDDPEPGMVELEPLEVMGPLDRPPGFDRSSLALKIGPILVPIAVTTETEGLMVILGIEEGRVTSCGPPEDIEPTLVAGDVCREILSVGGIKLNDGHHEAVVVRWHEPGNPEPG